MNSVGVAGLLVTAALCVTMVGALFYCLRERQDACGQWYLRLALRTRYLRIHPQAIEGRRTWPIPPS